jgi:hypothetical protein
MKVVCFFSTFLTIGSAFYLGSYIFYSVGLRYIFYTDLARYFFALTDFAAGWFAFCSTFLLSAF